MAMSESKYFVSITVTFDYVWVLVGLHIKGNDMSPETVSFLEEI